LTNTVNTDESKTLKRRSSYNCIHSSSYRKLSGGRTMKAF